MAEQPLQERSSESVAVHVAANHEVETFTGRYVDTSAPDPSTIVLEDIAHALAHTCRFGGHSARFYSVAEHAVHASDKLVKQGYGALALAGLHHDSAEAYLGDISRPLKPLLGFEYKKLTAAMNIAITDALGSLWTVRAMWAPAVKDADEWMLRVEALTLLPSKGEGWNWRPIPWRVFGPRELGLSPEDAETLFLERHHALAKAWAA